MSPLVFAGLSAVIALAACLQGSIGFGLGLVAAPVVTLYDPDLLPGLLILLAVVLTLAVAVRERGDINLQGTGWALFGRVPGTVLGTWLVVVLPHRWLALMIGAVVIGGVLLALSGWAPVPTRRAQATAGAASGLFGTATSIGGPPMALIWQSSSGARLRGTMAAFFLVGSSMSVALLALAGQISRDVLTASLLFLPAIAAGYALSRYANRFLSRPRQRALAVTASLLGATLLIANQLL